MMRGVRTSIVNVGKSDSHQRSFSSFRDCPDLPEPPTQPGPDRGLVRIGRAHQRSLKSEDRHGAGAQSDYGYGTDLGKNRKSRSLRLDELVREWIADYLEARGAIYPTTEALFISHGPKANGKQLSVVSAWRVVKEATNWLDDERAAAGAPDEEVNAIRAVSPHGRRHFLAQALLDNYADYKYIAQLLGHSSTVVTEQVYA